MSRIVLPIGLLDDVFDDFRNVWLACLDIVRSWTSYKMLQECAQKHSVYALSVDFLHGMDLLGIRSNNSF